MNRRDLIIGASAVPLAMMAAPYAHAGRGYSIAGVEVNASTIVRERIRYDMPKRVRWRLARLSRGGGRPVRVAVSLHTIDAFRNRFDAPRGVSVRYSVVDMPSGKPLYTSRFLTRVQPPERRDRLVVPLNPRTRGRQERELADRIARQIAREVS